MIGGCSLHRRTQMGARPPNNFGGLKTEKSEWRHLANVDDLRNLRYDWRNHQRAPRTAVAL